MRRFGRVAELVFERLGERLHPRLGHVVRRIAWRGRDALLRSGVDDEAGAPALDHAGREAPAGRRSHPRD